MKTVSKLVLLTATAAAVAASPASAQQNLVTNGGFETGSFSGWTQFGDTSNDGVSGTFRIGGEGGDIESIDPHGGERQAYFGAVGSQAGIFQTLNTVVGQTYNISVWVANFGGNPNFGSLTFGGVLLGSLTNNPAQPYTQYTFAPVATSARSELRFTFQHNPSWWLVDDVSVTGPTAVAAVPEPATWGMMILGFGVVGAAMRRRRTVSAKVSLA